MINAIGMFSQSIYISTHIYWSKESQIFTHVLRNILEFIYEKKCFYYNRVEASLWVGFGKSSLYLDRCTAERYKNVFSYRKAVV